MSAVFIQGSQMFEAFHQQQYRNCFNAKNVIVSV